MMNTKNVIFEFIRCFYFSIYLYNSLPLNLWLCFHPCSQIFHKSTNQCIHAVWPDRVPTFLNVVYVTDRRHTVINKNFCNVQFFIPLNKYFVSLKWPTRKGDKKLKFTFNISHRVFIQYLTIKIIYLLFYDCIIFFFQIKITIPQIFLTVEK